MERRLEDWLAWMEAQHPRQIELGLERIARVAARLALTPRVPVITVGGTNGKGSCVAFLEAMLRAQGYRVGAYTSPHLLRYNERVRIDGAAVGDAALCEAFTAIAAAMQNVSLTYFEFGTLAALWLFERAALDVVVLEVGLGGRLDAVNIVDADVAVLTTIDLDHQDWLGADREAIGAEKAGIFRTGRPALCADPQPPASVVAAAQQLGAQWLPVGTAFAFDVRGARWDWRGHALPQAARQSGSVQYRDLPLPHLPLPSAAAAIAALHCLPLPVSEAAIRCGLSTATLAGRFQKFERGGVEIIVDVAHNPQAARFLAARLAQLPQRRTAALLAIMGDKDADGVIAAMQGAVDDWFIGDLPNNARALPAAALAERLRAHAVTALQQSADVEQALRQALATLRTGERLVVFGSFYTAAAALAAFGEVG